MGIFWHGRRAVVLGLVLAGLLAGAAACGTAQAGRMASVSPEHLSARDLGWLNEAHQANLAEVDAGQLAETNASTAGIRSVGATLVRDHTALDARFIQVAARLKVSLVQYLTVLQTETGDRLSQELGFTFDHDFTGSMMTAHESLIAATRAEMVRGSSPPVIALARQALPVLEEHLRMLRAVAASG
jgi:putative membrane protein